ncbi:MAG: fibronectin type III domain-containing protein [Solirubrobacteraceae bacterium]
MSARKLMLVVFTAVLAAMAFAVAPAMAESAPVIVAQEVTGVLSTEATVSAEINPGGIPTGWHVEYEPGKSTPTQTIPAAGEPVNVSVRLTGLIPSSEYHLRLLVKNKAGEATPSTATFVTSAASLGQASLPDGRAYELVSSPEDTEVDVPEEFLEDAGTGEFVSGGNFGGYRASPDGDAMAYVGQEPASGNGGTGSGVDQYLATRGPNGWEAHDLSLTARAPGEEPSAAELQDLSPDLSLFLFKLQGPIASEPSLPASCPPNKSHLYSLTASGPHSVVTESDMGLGLEECPFFLARAGISENNTHVLLEGGFNNNLYDDVAGHIYQVNVLPGAAVDPNPRATFGGVSKAQSIHGPEQPVLNLSGDVSAEGSRVIWTDRNTELTSENPTGAERLFVRENDAQPQGPIVNGECMARGYACTVQADAAETGCGSCTGGGGEFWTASNDGSRVFFTDEQRLTADSTAASGEPDLYMYEIRASGGKGMLSDLTALGSGHADVQEVAGASKDGTSVYFVADGVLTQGPNTEGREPIAGQSNLYVWREGQLSFVAGEVSIPISYGTQYEGKGASVVPDPSLTPAEVASDGNAVAFFSTVPYTNYDNHGAEEIFVYGAGEKRLLCASCNPSGESPVHLGEGWESLYPVHVPRAISPWGTQEGGNAQYGAHWINEAGTEVFFSTNQPLVPQDSNGRQDVYEWEGDGTGACHRSVGCISPISDVLASHPARLIDASENGEDVFFTQRASLTLQAVDETVKLYDARIGGGFPELGLACTGTGCQGVPPAPPIFATPSSVTFAGVGNFEPVVPAAKPKSKPKAKKPIKCKRGFVKKRGRCVKRGTRVKKSSTKRGKKG